MEVIIHVSTVHIKFIQTASHRKPYGTKQV